MDINLVYPAKKPDLKQMSLGHGDVIPPALSEWLPVWSGWLLLGEII